MISDHRPTVAEAMARQAHADQPLRKATARQAGHGHYLSQSTQGHRVILNLELIGFA